MSNENLRFYNMLRNPPKNALKTIGGGRLKGKTDINPMWRIKILTETFGMCGFGWKYDIVDQWLEQSPNTQEISSFVNINMYVKVDGEWSEAIPGTGGSSFVTNEKNGLYANDECYKMALTDAISVSCKAIGIAADVYWNLDTTKYESNIEVQPIICEDCKTRIMSLRIKGNLKCISAKEIEEKSKAKYGKCLCIECGKKYDKKESEDKKTKTKAREFELETDELFTK